MVIQVIMQDLHEDLVKEIADQLGPRDRLRLGMTCKEYHGLFQLPPPETFPGVSRDMWKPMNASMISDVCNQVEALMQEMNLSRFFSKEVTECNLVRGSVAGCKILGGCRFYSTSAALTPCVRIKVPEAFGNHGMFIALDELDCVVMSAPWDAMDYVPTEGIDMKGLMQTVWLYRDRLVSAWGSYVQYMMQMHEDMRRAMDGIIQAFPGRMYQVVCNNVSLIMRSNGNFCCIMHNKSMYDNVTSLDVMNEYDNPNSRGRWRIKHGPEYGFINVDPEVPNSDRLKIMGLLVRAFPNNGFYLLGGNKSLYESNTMWWKVEGNVLWVL